MIETYAATTCIFDRLIACNELATAIAWVKPWDAQTAPIYVMSAPVDAPTPHILISPETFVDVRTQESEKEYSEGPVNVILVVDDRRQDPQYRAGRLAALALIEQCVSTPKEPQDVTLSNGATFSVTCDRLSARAFVNNEGGSAIFNGIQRFLVRVQGI